MAGETHQAPAPALPRVYRNQCVGTILLAFGFVAFFGFLTSAAFLLRASEGLKDIALIVGSAWIVLVPVYFFVEHLFIFRKWGDPCQYAQFKRLQDLAAKIWAAAVVVLAACYSANFPKTPM